ncbi:MAG TPA: MarR family winged helix-turn-helix transcriptional regulator [Actinomycetaceae bacterium]|nr:MarR family winged helix-turn-helix transcriptional regulator [Actinomycetaceae bacterium]
MPAPDPDDIARAWARELPHVPTRSIPVVTAAKQVGTLLRRERERTLHRLGLDAATLDLLSTLRRSGSPYTLSTRDLATQTLVTAGAISQRVTRAESAGLVRRSTGPGRTVLVELTPAGHGVVDRSVRDVLAVDDDLVTVLTDDEIRVLEDLLGRWLTALRARRPREFGAPAATGSADPQPPLVRGEATGHELPQ